ncbi:MAG: hypothetical protein R3275_11740 [Saprospiraceae bacterium]|nr:hypothetical protein [Saprospiraceae bacterium]
MADVLKDIGRLYDVRKFFLAFIILAICFQVLAFYSYGSFYWYLGDYFWYMFIFVTLVDAIIIARRAAKRSYVGSLERNLESYKDNFRGSLKIDEHIFDVEPSNIAVINDKPIRIEGRKEHMEQMKEFMETVKRINSEVEDRWPDEDDHSDWQEKLDARIFAELKVKEDDIDVIAKSKENLRYWLINYNKNLKKIKEAREKQFESIYEKGMIAITPVVLLITIAVQLGNVTNKLLFHVFGAL